MAGVSAPVISVLPYLAAASGRETGSAARSTKGFAATFFAQHDSSVTPARPPYEW